MQIIGDKYHFFVLNLTVQHNILCLALDKTLKMYYNIYEK